MSGLKTLVLMQLKDKIDMSFLHSVKKSIFKIVLSVLKFVIITAVIYLAFTILDYLRLISLLPGIPQNFLSVIVTIMIILSMIVCTFGLTKSLYAARDNAVLLTLPVGRTTVFTSKLIVYYLYEYIRNITFFMPIFVAFALINGYPIYFYIWLPIVMLILTAIPVCIGALLSIPLMYVTNFIKSHRWLEIISVTTFVSLIVWALVEIISLIPENFDLLSSWGTVFWEIQDFLVEFNQKLLPFTYITTAVVGDRYGTVNKLFTSTQGLVILIAIVLIAVVFAITFVIVKPLFFKMASSPFEYKRAIVRKRLTNKSSSSFMSSVKKELLTGLRTSGKMTSLLSIVIGLPVVIFLLNKIYAAMDTRLTGAYMAIAFNVLMILLIALSSSTPISYAYSEEGAASYLKKTIPSSYLVILSSKLFVNLTLMTTSIAVSVGIFSKFVDFTIWQGIQVFVVIEMIYLSHLILSAELDIMNPQTAQYQTVGTHVNNPNEIKSTIYGFLLSILFAFLVYFFIVENNYLVWLKIDVFAGLFLVLRIWLYVNKIRVYYKEI